MLSFQPAQAYRANLKDARFKIRITKKLVTLLAKIYFSGFVRDTYSLFAA